MNKTKAILTLAITIIVIAGIGGGYMEWMEMWNRPVETAATQTQFDYFTFLIYGTSNIPLDDTTPIEIVNWDCPAHILSSDINFKGSAITMEVLTEDYLSVQEMKNSFLNNTKIKFNTGTLIPSIECDLEGVEYVGYDCLYTTIGGFEYGGVCYDLGDYNLTFQLPPLVYDYEVEVLSNIKIAAVKGYLFGHGTIAFSGVSGKSEPFSDWYCYTGDTNRGDIYFVRVQAENENYPPKVVMVNHTATTSRYDDVEGELVDIITQKYEVEVFFEPLDEIG